MASLKKSIIRLIKAFGYSIEGFIAAFKTEEAFRIEVVLAALLIPAVFFMDITAVERALLIGSIFLVLIAECINTAVEACINRISDEIHPLSKKAKDVASTAVLFALINAAAIWFVVLI